MEETQVKNRLKIVYFKAVIFASLMLLLNIINARGAEAASLYFSPQSGNFNVGAKFAVSILVGSADQAMNAADGAISFPQDKLEVTSLTKNGSIINLWVREPSFSNSVGTINFEGIVYNPGYTGAAGKVLTINFRVKKAGTTAVVNFASGSVLANDGAGTNILSNLGTASFSFTTAGEAPQTPSANTPAAPKVSSLTHPDPVKWYANNNPSFEWTLPAGITGVNVLGDHKSNTNPGTRTDGVMSKYTFKDVDDGAWYFHIRLQNAAGWGAITHFPFKIDTEKPEFFNLKEVARVDLTDPRIVLRVEASDKLSGIDHYEIQIDDSAKIDWKDDGTHLYNTSPQTSGKHNITVKAVDQAGNFLESSLGSEVLPTDPPKITDYPETTRKGQSFTVKGITYPDGAVTLYVGRELEEVITKTATANSIGQFNFLIEEKLKEGDYFLWAAVTNKLGAQSGPSEKLPLTIKTAFTITPPLIVSLIILLLLPLIYILQKFNLFKKRIHRGVHQAESNLHKAFDQLRENMRKQLRLLERVKSVRQLTSEEEKIAKQLRRDLDMVEKLLKKEIRNLMK